MTVKELIDILQMEDQDKTIVLDGYEGGYWDVECNRIRHITIHMFENKEDWFGPHEKCDKENCSRYAKSNLYDHKDVILISRFEK